MDRRLLLAIALSVLVVIAYQEYLRIFYPQRRTPPVAAPRETRAPEARAPTVSPREAPAEPPGITESPESPAETATPPVADVRIETAVLEAELASRGARLMSLRLKKYRASLDPQSPGFQLVSPGMTELPLGMKLRGGDAAWNDWQLRYEPSASSLVLGEGESGSVVFRASLPDGGEVEKHFRFTGERYDFTVGILVRDGAGRYSEAALSWTRQPEKEQTSFGFHGVEALVGQKVLHFDTAELARGVIVPDARSGAGTAPLRWAGYADTYFLSAIAPGGSESPRLWVKEQPETGVVSTEVLVPIASAAKEPYPFAVYTGPKDLAVLAGAGHDLTRAVDLGWFGFVAEPMLHVLKFFHRMTANYGLDIILLTVLIKVLFFPLTQKSFRSMQDLQKLQPELKKLQERFKEDREQLNKEVMELYRRHKVNPLGGCLPMLFQMPIFIGLYNALLSAVELRHAPFALWINDLSSPDRLPALPNPPLAVLYGYDIRIPVLTLLMGASMLVQQKMSPPAADPMQQRMMMLMPVIFTVMFVNFPAGLVLYWLVNN
ncbi:MAG: membrane protein insertase YidC, partial [Candidatus Binatia bacterium]